MKKTNAHIFIALAAGIFLGAAFFDALPESADRLGWLRASVWFVGGIVLWWIQKVFVRWLKKPELPLLVASALWFHSILEGIVTGLAFGVSQSFGLLVLLGMVFHLLPEFFAAFTLMRNAQASNRTSAITPFVGFVLLFTSFGVTYRLLPNFGTVLPIAIALSGGAFFYIGAVSFWKRRSWALIVPLLFGTAIVVLQRLLLK